MFVFPGVFGNTQRNVYDASSNWTPTSLGSALKGWWKADAGVTLNGSDVSAWADQSGNGVTLSQGTAAKQPAYSATGFNSLPGLTWEPGQQQALESAADALALGNATMSVFVVGQMTTDTQAYGRIISFKGNGSSGDNGNTNSFCITRDNSNNTTNFFNNGGIKCQQATSLATNYRMGWIMDGANVTPYLNNAAGTSGALTSTLAATGTICIGNEATAQLTQWGGPVAEVIITNTALSSGDRLSLDNYFKAKWGL